MSGPPRKQASTQVQSQPKRDKYLKNYKVSVWHVGKYDNYAMEYFCNKYECDGRSGVMKLYDDVHGNPTVILSPYNYVSIKIKRVVPK